MFRKIQQSGFLLINLFILGINTVFAAQETVAPILPSATDLPTLPGPKGQSVDTVASYFQTTFLPKVAVAIIYIAVPLAVIFIIYGAIQFLTAYGNDEKLGNAKKTLYFSVIGLVISLLAYAIVQLVFYSAYYIPQQ